jgi:hypothetical protein
MMNFLSWNKSKYLFTLLGFAVWMFFFDDRDANVSTALSLGWQARRVRGVAELRQACAGLGLLA